MKAKDKPALLEGADRRAAMLGLAFAVTAGVAAAATPRRREDVLGRAKVDDVVPNAVGPWRFQPGGSVIVPDNAASDSIYDQVLTRVYVAPDQPVVMLLVAYGAAQSGLMQVHRPETCYGSQGFKVSDDRAVALTVGGGRQIAAKAFSASRADREEQVLYWTRISDAFPRTPAGQRWTMLRRGLQGVIPDGVLVRMSTPGVDDATGQRAMAAFATALVAQAAPLERALLLGPLRRTA